MKDSSKSRGDKIKECEELHSTSAPSSPAATGWNGQATLGRCPLRYRRDSHVARRRGFSPLHRERRSRDPRSALPKPTARCRPSVSPQWGAPSKTLPLLRSNPLPSSSSLSPFSTHTTHTLHTLHTLPDHFLGARQQSGRVRQRRPTPGEQLWTRMTVAELYFEAQSPQQEDDEEAFVAELIPQQQPQPRQLRQQPLPDTSVLNQSPPRPVTRRQYQSWGFSFLPLPPVSIPLPPRHTPHTPPVPL